jgi:4-carboxymuconolactone decarboxylase
MKTITPSATASSAAFSGSTTDLKARIRSTKVSRMTTNLAGAEPQLKVHVNAGLNVGLSAREVAEPILHCIPYTGFPRVLNAILSPSESSSNADSAR